MQCVICSDDNYVKAVTETSCGHFYHTECLNEWLSTQKGKCLDGTCPICRKVLEEFKQDENTGKKLFNNIIETFINNLREEGLFSQNSRIHIHQIHI